MDYGKMLSDSFSYAKGAVWGKWVRWILLVISTIIFPLILGYMVRIYSGVKPAPDVGNWVRTFIDGLKLIIIGIIYSIPVFIVALIFGVPLSVATDPAATAAGIWLLVMIIVGLLVTLISTMGIIRFARKNSMGQAFAFGAILQHIGKIGWGSYILALIILWVVGLVFGFIAVVLALIPFIGLLILLFLYPVWIIFGARYLTLIYESAPEPA
ncbi:DUF4013 domain-containing protein [Methanoculleus sp.]|uniref:DUF4013 domain-containing protein n=1 Tax=Methanoculleus sp. TaxID=90427 RepID=UPI0026236C50|nr:DUF4013 domain-containing protein [Methanoculleus sp.]MDI6866659.1 DUF4013 domain-containing protein [Methanoculleus sp.]